jgi:DNA polymerase-2
VNATLQGWVLDVYSQPHDGLVIWFLTEDGLRYRLVYAMPIPFYAAASASRLAQISRWLESQPVKMTLGMDQRRDLFAEEPVPVLAIRVEQAAEQPVLFHKLEQEFPEVVYYDADVPVALRVQAETGAFPLAYCRVEVAEENRICHIEALDTPWELDPLNPPLRILALEPDVNPAHAPPKYIQIHYEQHSGRLALQPERPFLINLCAILQSYNPDLLLTNWGDTWLLPYLMKLARRLKIPLQLNREPGRAPAFHRERSYFSYGQIIHRGEQIHLFGRWHIDRCNAMLWGDYGLDGIFELTRVTGLPVQTSARVSPGSGISAMQMLTALRTGVLIPWHKQQAEDLKSALDLFYGDQGGLVYQPEIGLHSHVGEVDFISMYPSVMVHYNISPETVGSNSPSAEDIPELGLKIDRSQPGLVPQTLAPLLEKRIAFKQRIAELPEWDPRRKRYQVCASAHKWLLVTCFGYLGYKNARFGRIEAHQAVTAYGREVLLGAKDTAEDMGFGILHMYVDGLWVIKPGAEHVADFQPLLDEMADRTGLPVALDGIYRWVAFLSSRRDERIPVPNRYFGVFQDGSIKVRGIEARRQDTPPFIARTQMEMLELLADSPDAAHLPEYLPALRNLLRKRLAELRSGKVPVDQLLVTLKLSRSLEEFRTPSPCALALRQIQSVGKSLRPGQRIRFFYTMGKPGVYAWDLPDPLNPARLDLARYRTLMLRAAFTILQPLGMDESILEDWIDGHGLPVLLPVFNGQRVSGAAGIRTGLPASR